MRYYFLLITLAMIAWVANAGITGVGHMQSKALDSESNTPNETTDALVPEIPPEIANGGQVLPPPAGPPTEAEIKADSALACMAACGGKVDCQNQCIGTTYGVALGTPPPVVTGSVPPPIGATSTSSAGGSSSTSGVGNAGNVHRVEIYQMIGALVIVALASMCTSF